MARMILPNDLAQDEGRAIFSLEDYQHLKQINSLFNKVIHRLCFDQELMNEALLPLAKIDLLVEKLLHIYNTNVSVYSDRILMGCNRTDYMAHYESGDINWKLVEIGTVSVGGTVHQHRVASTYLMKKYVIKSQKEASGDILINEEVSSFLQENNISEMTDRILMERITSPVIETIFVQQDSNHIRACRAIPEEHVWHFTFPRFPHDP